MTHNNIVIGTVIAVVIVVGSGYALFKKSNPSPVSNEPKQESKSDNKNSNNQKTVGNNQTDSTELKKETIKEGTGPEAKSGDTVEVHYTGTLTDGTKFDSSVDRGTPFTFNLGAGEVIQGWDQGVAGMKVGEKVKLTIPSDLAYGDAGRPPVIPAKATLIFEVELLKIN